MDIVISSAHGLKVRGAKGLIDEVDESRRVTDRVAELLKSVGHKVMVFHDNTSTSVAANLAAIVGYHQRQKRQRDVSVHFNMFQATSAPRGTECLHKSMPTLAAQVSKAMADAGGFINRGAKRRTDLRFLNQVANSILLEVCFVDSGDVPLYRANFEAICRGIAESVGGIPIAPPTTEPTPPTIPELPSIDVTGENIVDLEIKVTGKASVFINGDPITEVTNSPNRLEFTLKHHGDILLIVDGEDFQIES